MKKEKEETSTKKGKKGKHKGSKKGEKKKEVDEEGETSEETSEETKSEPHVLLTEDDEYSRTSHMKEDPSEEEVYDSENETEEELAIFTRTFAQSWLSI